MNNQHAKSTLHETKGKIKEEVGHLTGNTRTESEGVGEQIKAKVERAYGDVKDAVKKGVDKVLNTPPAKK